MSERTTYPNGVPSWVDVATPDVDASVAFYSGLFGWQHAAAEPVEETGGYGMFMLRDKYVAGIAPLQDPSQPAVWSTYIAVDDADATAAAATEASGQVAMGPMDVMDSGRMAFLIDPVGAFVGVWQARRHPGAQIVNEHGSLGWNELTTRDPQTAQRFYVSVFGWDTETVEMGGSPYTVFNLDGRAIAGMMAMGEGWPEEMPSHWMTYFTVDDVDASVARAHELGGTVAVEAVDAPGVGRFAVLNDPHGTAFSIIAPTNPTD